MSMNSAGYADVNSFVNETVSYVADVRDEWQSPDETMQRKAGDCEDYAVLKFTLLKAKYPSVKLAYSLIMVNGKTEPHMVVLLDNFVLDNYTNEIVDVNQRKDLKIAFTVDEQNVYVDGKQTKIHPCDLKGLSRLCR